MRKVLYLCIEDSVENLPRIVSLGSTFSLLFFFYELFYFFGAVRNRMKCIVAPLPFMNNDTLFFAFYHCAKDVTLYESFFGAVGRSMSEIFHAFHYFVDT